MTLVDDIDGEAAEDKQFIIVTSKTGNYFYIIIDRAAEGENTVHFLNQVDEADLLSLIEEEEQAPAVCSCTTKCTAGAVNTYCEVCAVNMAECAGPEPGGTGHPGGRGRMKYFTDNPLERLMMRSPTVRAKPATHVNILLQMWDNCGMIELQRRSILCRELSLSVI